MPDRGNLLYAFPKSPERSGGWRGALMVATWPYPGRMAKSRSGDMKGLEDQLASLGWEFDGCWRSWAHDICQWIPCGLPADILTSEFSDGDVAFEVSEFQGDSCDMDRKGDLSLWERSRESEIGSSANGVEIPSDGLVTSLLCRGTDAGRPPGPDCAGSDGNSRAGFGGNGHFPSNGRGPGEPAATKRMVPLVLELLRPYRSGLAVVFAAMMVETAMSLAAPWP